MASLRNSLWGPPPTEADIQRDTPKVADDRLLDPNDPTSLLVMATRHETAIREEILEFGKNVAFLQTTTQAVYAMKKYVPEHVNELPTWKNEIIPAMKDALLQDIEITNAFTSAISAIRVVATILRKGSQAIDSSRGSDVAVRATVQHLGAAFDRLQEAKQRVAKSEGTVLAAFQKNADEILKQMGSYALRGTFENIRKHRSEIAELIKRVEEMESKKNGLVGSIESLENFRVVILQALKRGEEAVKEWDLRTKALQRELDQAVRRMDSIPATVIQKEEHCQRSWWFGRRIRSETIYRQVANPNRQCEIQFLEGLTHIRDGTERNKKEKDQANIELLEKLTHADKELASKKAELRFYTSDKGFEEQQQLIKRIAELEVAIEKELETASKAQVKYGLNGDVLVDFLTEVDVFFQQNQGKTKVVEPLVGILENVQAQFVINFQILRDEAAAPESEDKVAKIYTAGKGMLKELGFLDACATILPLLCGPPDVRENFLKKALQQNGTQSTGH